MPQLDVNTFFNQYTSLISVLVLIYIILSYVVLPITLNTILVRGYSLRTNSILRASNLLFNAAGTCLIFTRSTTSLDYPTLLASYTHKSALLLTGNILLNISPRNINCAHTQVVDISLYKYTTAQLFGVYLINLVSIAQVGPNAE